MLSFNKDDDVDFPTNSCLIDELTHDFAQAIHRLWVHRQLDDGWRVADDYDPIAKTDPLLLDYHQPVTCLIMNSLIGHRTVEIVLTTVLGMNLFMQVTRVGKLIRWCLQFNVFWTPFLMMGFAYGSLRLLKICTSRYYNKSKVFCKPSQSSVPFDHASSATADSVASRFQVRKEFGVLCFDTTVWTLLATGNSPNLSRHLGSWIQFRLVPFWKIGWTFPPNGAKTMS